MYIMQIFFDISFTSNLPYALGTVGVALGAALGGGGGGTPGSANEVCRLNFNLREWNRRCHNVDGGELAKAWS